MTDYKPSAVEIKQIRSKTLAGFQDCQKALVEAKGDMSVAEDIIKKKGLQVAAKKAHREASEGLVASVVSDDLASGAIVEVNIETDFAAKNEEFIKLTDCLVKHVLGAGPDTVTNGEDLYDIEIHPDGGRTIKTVIDETIGKIGENMGLKRAVRFVADTPGVIHSYIHPPGKLGVLIEVGIENETDKDKADELAHELALQIAFADPGYVSPEDIPVDILAKERKLAEAKAREQGKPDHIVPKIAEGMLRKYYSEECLLEQAYAKEPKITIKDMIKKSAIPGFVVKRFVRFTLTKPPSDLPIPPSDLPIPQDAREMESIPSHLLKLLKLPPESGLSMLKSSTEPFTFVTSQGSEIFDPKDYSHADISWAEQVLKIGLDGQELAQDGKFTEAIPLLEKALGMAPGHDLCLLTLGVCYASIGQFPKAISILERAAKLYPTNQRIKQNLDAVKKAQP